MAEQSLMDIYAHLDVTIDNMENDGDYPVDEEKVQKVRTALHDVDEAMGQLMTARETLENAGVL